MKKLFLLSALFATGLALTSCADRTEEVRGEYTGLLDRFDQKGEAYMSLLISTPTESGTRADDNFDEGTEAENAVSSALLFLFVEESDGNNGTTTKLQGVYDMAVGAPTNGTGTVAKQCTAVISSNGVSNTATLKAYVACNYGQVFTGLDASKHTVKLAKDNKEIALDTSWEDFQKLEAESIGIITWDDTNKQYVGSNMYMSNAPLADALNPDSDTAPNPEFNPTITTLAEVNTTNIKQTASEAQDAPAATVFVERAAVKVTVTFDSGAKKIGTDGAEFSDAQWFINNTAPTYYNVRNIDTEWSPYYSAKYLTDKSKYFYRFVSKTKVDDDNNLYHTYWAIDPTYNYTENKDTEDKLDRTIVSATAPEHWLGNGKNAFCTENTMNIHGMTKDKTTCISIALKFNNGTGFWTSADKPDVILNINDSKNEVLDKIWEYAKNNHTADYTAFIALFSDNETNAKGDITTDFLAQTIGTTAGEIQLGDSDDGPKSTKTDAAATKFEQDLKEAFNALKFKYYAGGMAYYLLPIRHFGNVETPLAQETNGAYYALYGDGTNAQPENYLGRYGVVRNNWYNITIEGVLRMGSPTTFEGGEETPPQDPDDDVYSYLSAKIHILKWAKRAYGVKI